MFLARSANLRVAQVSSNAEEAGETVAMMAVLQLPPSESCSRCVSLESLHHLRCHTVKCNEETTTNRLCRLRIA